MQFNFVSISPWTLAFHWLFVGGPMRHFGHPFSLWREGCEYSQMISAKSCRKRQVKTHRWDWTLRRWFHIGYGHFYIKSNFCFYLVWGLPVAVILIRQFTGLYKNVYVYFKYSHFKWPIIWPLISRILLISVTQTNKPFNGLTKNTSFQRA